MLRIESLEIDDHILDKIESKHGVSFEEVGKRWEVGKMTDIDKALEKIEQGNAWDETDEVVRLEVKKPLDKVIPVRLPADKWEQIREEARELGVGPTTLARMWILQHLRQRVKA